MKHALILSLLAFAAGCATTPAAPKVDAFSPPVRDIMTFQENAQSRAALTRLEGVVQQSLESPEQRRALAAELTALLHTDATHDAKQFACRQLVLVGGPENVPGIAALLSDPKTADMARYALEPIQAPQVDAALLRELKRAPDPVKVGIINSLGERRTKSASGELTQLAKSGSPQVAAAAKDALTKLQ